MVLLVALLVTAGVAVAYAVSNGLWSSSVQTGTAAQTTMPAASTAPASSVAASTSPTTSPQAVTITAVGDMELGNTPNVPTDPAGYLQPMRAVLAAPVVFANLEGTLTDATGSKCGASSSNCYAFRNPPSFAAALRSSGFTVLNSANNHAHDFGTQGVADTTAALQGAGIVQSGLPGQIGLQKVGTSTVAFVAFAPYSNTNSLLDLAGAKTLIAQARTQADIVVVYMHAGAEGTAATHVTGSEESYVGEDRGNAKVFAHAAVDDGADLVIASGPHVLRGIEAYKGRVIAYSLGNFAGDGNFATSGSLDLSGVLTVNVTHGDAPATGRFTSLVLSSQGRPSVDPSGAAAAFVNQLSTADFGPAAVIIQPSGQLTMPAPPA